uniref:NADH-ubiquinone oxidoreductase chain 4L n=1 Tax=Zaptyx stimpsoni strictaluna TaxID=1885719 RepID=A0A224ABF3_9EUPU|nr:NADH dehydrogenase subunit 4L [Zaptyx stimpsoni strictaluna]
MINLLFFFIFMLMVTHLYFFSTFKHYLSALLSLEAMILVLLVFVLTINFMFIEGLGIYMFVLTLSVCEAAVGLTLLISVVKFKSNDLINNFSINF